MSKQPAPNRRSQLYQTIRPFLVCFVAISLLFGCFTAYKACGEDSKPVISVGSEVEFPPFALVDEDGKPAGFSVDLIKAIAHAAGLSIIFETGEWDKMWNGLISGKLDVLPVVAKSSERMRLVDFGLPHTETFDAFFVRDGSPTIGSIEAAQGKKIVVMRSDAAHHELLNRNFQGELALVETIPEGLSMVAAGKGDAFLCSKLIGSLAIKKHGIRGLTAGPFIPDYKRVFSVGVRKGADELREKLNQGLLIVKASGQYDRIYEKWLSVDDPWLKYRKYLVPAFLVAAAIALLTMLGLAILRRLVKMRTAELAAKNQELEQQITARERTEDELLRHKQGLEILIQERTRALKESEARLRSYFEIPVVGIAITSLDKGWLEVNPALCNILGYSQQELSCMTWAELTHPDDLAADVAQFERVLAGEIDTYSMEKRFIRKNGDFLWTTLSVSCVRNPEGSVDYTVALLQDITERKRAEEAALRLVALVESSDDAIIGKTLDGTITSWNKGAERLYGYGAEEVIGQPVSLLLLPELFDDLPDILTRLSQGEVISHLETRRLTKDKRIIEVDLTISPIKTQQGQIIGVSSTARDIADRKRLEAERLEMERKLLHAQKLESLAVMASAIAHDFNNLLMVVLGNLELALADLDLAPETRQRIEKAIQASERSAELSHQMLIYSGSGFYNPKDLDLAEVAHKSEDLLKSNIPRTTTLHLEINEGLPFIRGDEDQAMSVIKNLAMNATEAIGQKDGDVTLMTSVMVCDENYLSRSRLEEKPEPGRFVFLEVTDTGCGMDAETQHKLFDPFFSTKFWGRGLGMAEVMGIVKGHHGAIIVESDVGKGTTVRVLFPAVDTSRM